MYRVSFYFFQTSQRVFDARACWTAAFVTYFYIVFFWFFLFFISFVVLVALCLHLNVQIHLRLFSTFFLGECECTKTPEIERN